MVEPIGEVTEGEQAAVPFGWVGSAVAAIARHPSLWATGVRQAAVLAAPGWWRRPPFLPVPATEYMRFRLQTAYGGAGERQPEGDDLVTYLRWCRDARRWRAPAAR